uniref:Uncharacterized protein n=1 Tax=Setaria digitata TaxID=48799 RepID=A0A915Q2K4_9BILA
MENRERKMRYSRTGDGRWEIESRMKKRTADGWRDERVERKISKIKLIICGEIYHFSTKVGNGEEYGDGRRSGHKQDTVMTSGKKD